LIIKKLIFLFLEAENGKEMPLDERGKKRVLREMEKFHSSTEKKFYQMLLDPDNMQMAYGILFELDDPYKGGEYIIEIKLPDDYPFVPPVVKFLTPNGRFKNNVPICLSITHYHSETWSPHLDVEKVIQSVTSVLFDKDINPGVGFIETSDEEKKKLAWESTEYNKVHNKKILSWREK